MRGMTAGVLAVGMLFGGVEGTAWAAQAETVAMPVPPGPGQVKDDLLAGTERFAAGAKEVTEVNMDKNTLGMMGGKNEMAGKLDFIVVHTYEYAQKGMYRMEDMDVFRKRLEDGSWNCVVRERSKEDSSDICIRRGGDHETNEMIVMTAEPKEVTFVHMKGRMSLGDLGKMGSVMGQAPPTPPAPPLIPRAK